MLAIERKKRIVELVVRHRNVVVADLSRQFGVTEETIRRDLTALEQQGYLDRTHGGAVSRKGESEDLPYGTRHLINLDAKHKIAAKAADIVKDGQSVLLDSSSTAYEAALALKAHSDLTVITNSVRLLADADAPNHTVISVGGELRRSSATFVGSLTVRSISQFNADIALISCKALSIERGIMEANVGDAEVKRAFIASAACVCLLVDGDKFDQSALISIGALDDIDMVITDRAPPPHWIDFLRGANIELLF